MKPKLLDLFCGAGGASMGYFKAGFEVYGLDIEPQSHYPFKLRQDDALEAMDKLLAGHYLVFQDEALYLENFDAFHASPPCQAYSMAAIASRKDGVVYSDLVADTRECLSQSGKPWVIENVPGSPLINPTMFNGAMFGMRIVRKRFFETSFLMPLILCPRDEQAYDKMGRPVKEGDMITPVGHFSNVPYAQRQMGIDWMTQTELAQAIPPAYTEYIGKYLMQAVTELV